MDDESDRVTSPDVQGYSGLDALLVGSVDLGLPNVFVAVANG